MIPLPLVCGSLTGFHRQIYFECTVTGVMEKTAIKQKLNILEAEVKVLRLATRRPIDLGIDDANWRKVKATSKRVRRTLFRKLYG